MRALPRCVLWLQPDRGLPWTRDCQSLRQLPMQVCTSVYMAPPAVSAIMQGCRADCAHSCKDACSSGSECRWIRLAGHCWSKLPVQCFRQLHTDRSACPSTMTPTCVSTAVSALASCRSSSCCLCHFDSLSAAPPALCTAGAAQLQDLSEATSGPKPRAWPKAAGSSAASSAKARAGKDISLPLAQPAEPPAGAGRLHASRIMQPLSVTRYSLLTKQMPSLHFYVSIPFIMCREMRI